MIDALPPVSDPYYDWFSDEGRDFSITNREGEAFDYDMVLSGDLTNLKIVPLGDVGTANSLKVRLPLQESSLFVDPTNIAADTNSLKAAPEQQKADRPDLEAIVAVIDDGVNFGHDRFCLNDKTRIQYAWVQDGVKQLDGAVPFGREWERKEIDAAINASTSPDSLLRNLDLIDFTRKGVRTVSRRMSHGTHMTDLATGYSEGMGASYDPFTSDETLLEGIDPAKIGIITVQLPFLMTQESSGATYEPFVSTALKYVLERARQISEELGRSLPVVINFSYAIAGGPHNGESRLDQSLRKIFDSHRSSEWDGGTVMIVPSGNRYMERGHFQYKSSQDENYKVSLPWRILPGDQTSSFLEIWMPELATGSVNVALPNGTSLHYYVDSDPDTISVGTDVIARISTDTPNDTRRKRVLIAIAPTDLGWMPIAGRRRPSPSGIWEISLDLDLKQFEFVDAWIQRDESPYLYRANAVQSYFDDPDYQRFNKNYDEGAVGDVLQSERTAINNGSNYGVTREGTLSGIATLKELLVVGGRLGRVSSTKNQVTPALYAAAGFSRTRGGKSEPDVSAICDRSRFLTGVLAAGTSSGSRVAVQGTSAAAPQVARLLVEEILRRKKLVDSSDQSAVKSIVEDAKHDLIGRHVIDKDAQLRLGNSSLGRLYQDQHSLNRPHDSSIDMFAVPNLAASAV